MMTCAPLTGTPSGYQRHKRASEKPCGACRDARNAHRRHWRATRKPGQPRPVPPGLTCAACGDPFAGEVVRRTPRGLIHPYTCASPDALSDGRWVMRSGIRRWTTDRKAA